MQFTGVGLVSFQPTIRPRWPVDAILQHRGDLVLNLGEYRDTKPSMRRDIILQHGVNFNRENST
jgi:hypothetical protein